MANASVMPHVRMEQELKTQATQALSAMGLTMRRSGRSGRIVR